MLLVALQSRESMHIRLWSWCIVLWARLSYQQPSEPPDPVDHNCPAGPQSSDFDWTCKLDGTWYVEQPSAGPHGRPFGPPRLDPCWTVEVSGLTPEGTTARYNISVQYHSGPSCDHPHKEVKTMVVAVPKVPCHVCLLVLISLHLGCL